MSMLLALSMADPHAGWLPYQLPEVKAFLIGRHPDCSFTLDHASVSRHHAKFSSSENIWHVEDLNSRNGTYRNGKRIKASELMEGDILHIGDWALVFSEHNTENLDFMTSWLERVKAQSIELGVQIYVANNTQTVGAPVSTPPPSAPKIPVAPKTSRHKLPVTRAKPSEMLNPAFEGTTTLPTTQKAPAQMSGLKRMAVPPAPR